MKKVKLLIFAFVVIINTVNSQITQNRNQENLNNSNFVKNIIFKSQGTYYPLTVLLSPYGYWQHGMVRIGHKKFENIEYLRNITFGWNINGSILETPRYYIYDTLTTDTISSLFKSAMYCYSSSVNNFYEINNHELISSLDSISFAILVQEFKYSYLLRDVYFDDKDREILRIVYPKNSYPYKTSFNFITFVIWSDSIKMTSVSLNTENLLNIKVVENGSVFLKTKDYKRLRNSIKNSIFNELVDCNNCSNSAIILTIL